MIPTRPTLGQTLVYFILVVRLVLGALTNVTVDDAAVLTDAPVLQYLPSPSAWYVNNCNPCIIGLGSDLSKAYNGTWHAPNTTSYPCTSATQCPMINFTFTGSALYIYFILENDPASSPTNLMFFLDDNGPEVGQYRGQSSSQSGYQYNVSVYAKNSLALGEHTMTMALANNLTGPAPVLMFDYLIYTTHTTADNSTATLTSTTASLTSTTATSVTSQTFAAVPGETARSPTNAVVGGAVGGISLLMMVSIVSLIRYQRNKKRGRDQSLARPVTAVEPFVAYFEPTSRTKTVALSANLQLPALPSSIAPVASGSGSGSGTSSPDLVNLIELLRNEVAGLRNLRLYNWDQNTLPSQPPPEYYTG